MVVAGALIVIFLRWPGTSTRTAVPLSDRLMAVVTDPLWYAKFPAVGTGAISIPLAVWWAFPVSVLVLALGAAAGARLLPNLGGGRQPSAWSTEHGVRVGVVFAGLALLVNLPPMVTLPHDHGPRVFTPTWLLLSAAAAVVGPRLARHRMRLVGGFAGLFAAGALLSLALSVSVRVETADFTERSSRWLAARVPDGGRVVVCDVPRTAATPAPNGPFALHELHETWSAEAAVKYYTGKKIRIERTGVYWDAGCEHLPPADLVIGFDELRRQTLH
jgi:hypothetical protein